MKIKEILDFFQNAYDNKDIDNVEGFMKELFVSDKNIAIQGTSDGELYLDYEGCKRLFVSDWKYWGFEKLEIDKANVLSLGELIVVNVPATFAFTFTNSSIENRVDHFNDIIGRLTDKDQRPLKVKFGEILYELVHIYHSRDAQERKYRFNLNVTFILNKDFKVVQINFSVPDNILRPDARLYEKSDFNRFIESEMKKLRSVKNDDSEKTTIREFLKDVFNDYFNNELKCYSDNVFVQIADNNQATNLEKLKALLNYQKNYYDSLSVYADDAYIEVFDDCALIITKAIAYKKINKEEYFNLVKNEILELENQDINVTKKMFKIRQLITFAYKETSIGEEFEFPIRLHMVLRKINNQWKVSYMQQSYSFFYLLEDKNEFMELTVD